jgi:hypothetical protein
VLHIVAGCGNIEFVDELRKQLTDKVNKLVDEVVNITLREGNRMAMARMREARAKYKGREGMIPFAEHPNYPKEKEALEFMIQQRKKGISFRLIAEGMERHGFMTRYQKENWNPGTVLRILKRQGIA